MQAQVRSGDLDLAGMFERAAEVGPARPARFAIVIQRRKAFVARPTAGRRQRFGDQATARVEQVDQLAAGLLQEGAGRLRQGLAGAQASGRQLQGLAVGQHPGLLGGPHLGNPIVVVMPDRSYRFAGLGQPLQLRLRSREVIALHQVDVGIQRQLRLLLALHAF